MPGRLVKIARLRIGSGWNSKTGSPRPSGVSSRVYVVLRAEPHLRLAPVETRHRGRRARSASNRRRPPWGRPTSKSCWRIQLAGDEDEPSAFLADEMRDHLGPLRPQGPQVGVDQEEGVVPAQLCVVVGQPRDRAVARLAKARIGMLDPAGELDVLVAHQRIAQELHLGRGRAGDQQDADLLADDLHRGGRDVVVLRQLGAGVLDPRAELILADHPGRDPERRPLEDAVFAQHDALTAERLPRPRR